MSRRRLLISSFSDEEEETDDGNVNIYDNGNGNNNANAIQSDGQFESTHQHPNPNPTLHPIDPGPISISDDDFIDVAESFTPPSPPPPQPPPPQQQHPVSTGCPIGDFLLSLGLSLKIEWVGSCLRQLNVTDLNNDDVAAKAKLCFEQVLFSDMNYCGNGVLPPNIDSMHLVDLAGPFVLQVDEVVNISCALKARYHEAACGIKRCLKLSMTDGVQRVYGMEYRPVKDLRVLAPAGFKVAICNVQVRHGLLMLVPEALEVLGGMVEELEAARQHLVNEVNKPSRGRRSRAGVVPPLATRATRAAWPESGHNLPSRTSVSADTPGLTNNYVNVLQQANSSVDTLQHTNSSVDTLQQTNTLVSTLRQTNSSVDTLRQTNISVDTLRQTNSSVDTPQLTNSSINTLQQTSSSINTTLRQTSCSVNTTLRQTSSSVNTTLRQTSSSVITLRQTNGSVNGPGHIDSSTIRCSMPFQADGQGIISVLPRNNSNQRTTEEFVGPGSAENVLPPLVSSVLSDVDQMSIDPPSLRREEPELNDTSSTILKHDVHMLDEFEHPLILSGEREVPFTYLASLSAKWAAMKENTPSIQGKIKCCLTGVKGFQYRQRRTYELQAYVDDGSLICEVLIDHNVVQKGIGHSPEEVTAALTSPDKKRVSDMKETLRKFQIFLANFEGIITVEMNSCSPLPVALEMNEGCPSSDAWLLARRLGLHPPSQTPQLTSDTDPIDLSP